MISNRIALSGAALLSAWMLAPGCSNDLDPSQSGAVGTAQAAVNNVPSDGSVACISVTSTGSWATTQSFDVMPGQSTVFTLTGIPIGTVRFDGFAYATSCGQVTPSSTPTWVSTPVLASVVIGQTTAVTLSLQQAGNAGIGVGFTPEPACRSNGLPCLTGSECCSTSCGSNSTCQPAPAACAMGLTQCGGACVDTSSDVNNCGACGSSCQAGGSCTQGVCGSAPVCGDGLIGGAELCDDGNSVNGDGCSAGCTVEAGFACFGAPSVCFAACGDGVVTGSEQCDDANSVNGDGCSASCTVEAGFICFGVPSACSPVCGDGVVAGSEQCDDGNVTNGDGCSNACTIEASCVDAIKNGMETDIDCGGPSCAPCASGKSCAADADCASGVCVPGLLMCQ